MIKWLVTEEAGVKTMTKKLNPEEVVGLIGQGADIIIPIANGEPGQGLFNMGNTLY